MVEGIPSSVEDVLEGNYAVLLSLPRLVALASIPDASEMTIDNLQNWFQKFRVAIHEKTFAAIKAEDAEVLMDILATGVAALLSFVQENVTG